MSTLLNSSSETFKIGAETVFGTAATPTKSLKHSGATADVTIETVEDPSYTGSRGTAGSTYVGELVNIGWPTVATASTLGYAFAYANGKETITPASVGANTFKFEMKDDSSLPSATIETSIGGVFPYTNTGCVVKSLAIEVNPKANITVKTEWVGVKQVSKATATPLTIANEKVFTFNDARTGAVEVEGGVVGYVNTFKLNLDNSISTDDRNMGGEGKPDSLPAGKRKLTGSMKVKYNGDTKFFDAYIRESKIFDMKLTFDTLVPVGASDTEKFVIHLNAIQLSNWKRESGDFVYFTADFTVVGDGAYFELTTDRATSFLA